MKLLIPRKTVALQDADQRQKRFVWVVWSVTLFSAYVLGYLAMDTFWDFVPESAKSFLFVFYTPLFWMELLVSRWIWFPLIAP